MDEISFSHPHDHFKNKHVAVVPGTCFILMPFDPRFTIVYESIVTALKGIMTCSRADDLPIGSPILERVLIGIRAAELIVADLTGKNPNVFYELGIAHTQTKNALLLTRHIDDVPFDLRGLFCHTYSVDSMQGINDLQDAVRAAAFRVRARTTPSILKGTIDRTEQIVRYLDRVLALPQNASMPLIRIQAAFGSLANEGYPDDGDKQMVQYGELLELERDRIVQLLERGATLQAIIHPPAKPRKGELADRWRRRIERLLRFIDERSDLWPRWDIVISSEPGPNLLFVGEEVLFEGYKTAISGGFGSTMVYVDKQYLATRLTIFDTLFEAAKQHMLAMYGAGMPIVDHGLVRQAVRMALIAIRDV